MIRCLTIGRESESAKRLDLPLHISQFKQTVEKFDSSIIVRWGNSNLQVNSRGVPTEFKHVLNPSRAISENCHKYNSMRKMSAFVNVPTLYDKEIPKGVIAVVRKFSHSSGKDFKVVTGPYKLKSDEYGAKYLKTNLEYRVWFCGNATMWSKRIPLDEKDNQGEYPCRSNWGYKSVSEPVPDSLHKDTLAAAKSIGLDFGAADVLKFENKFYFLELNSGVTVDTVRIERFFKDNIFALMKVKFAKNFDELANFERLKKENYIFPEVANLENT